MILLVATADSGQAKLVEEVQNRHIDIDVVLIAGDNIEVIVVLHYYHFIGSHRHQVGVLEGRVRRAECVLSG